jgi:hypothetical protein
MRELPSARQDRRMLNHCDVYASLELAAAVAAGASLTHREQLLRRARSADRSSQLQVFVTEARRVTVRLCLPAAMLLALAATAALIAGCEGVGRAGAVAAVAALLACPASLPSETLANCARKLAATACPPEACAAQDRR